MNTRQYNSKTLKLHFIITVVLNSLGKNGDDAFKYNKGNSIQE